MSLLPPLFQRPRNCFALTGLLFMGTLTGCSAAGPSDTIKSLETVEKKELKVTFQSTTEEVVASDAVMLTMTLKNATSMELPFLPINTAFEHPLQADVFEVLLDGEMQPYLGVKARRLPLVAEDFMLIGPDEALEQTINLAEYYKIDLPGTYLVRYVPKTMVVGPELGIEPASVLVDTEELEITVK